MNRSLLKVAQINLAVLVLLALLGLAGVELWLRLTVPASSESSIFKYTLDTPRYKVMKPNASVLAWGKELRTNDRGFRDEAATVPAKQPGEFRVIVLGASFTVSAGVAYRQIYTTLLQERLQQTYPRVSVVNLAVGGYNIVQQAMVLQEVGLRLEPDMVLVALSPDSDFSNDIYEANYRVASGKQPAEPVQAWYETLYVHRAYLGRVQARLQRMLAGKGPEQPGPADGEGARGWEKNVAALQTIADIARGEKLPLKVALLPPTWHFEKERPLFGRVEAVCRQREIACVNLLEPFIARRVDESTLRLNPLDAHPNERYNALVAEELSPHLAAVLAGLKNRDGLRQVGFARARAASGRVQ